MTRSQLARTSDHTVWTWLHWLALGLVVGTLITAILERFNG